MSEDFVTRLELQLTDAERRQERGTRLDRLRARTRTSLPSRSFAIGFAVVACAVVAVAVGAVRLTRGSDRETTVPPPASHVVARIATGSVNRMAPGYGQLWMAEMDRGQLLRVDPASHRIVARIPIGHLPTDVAMAAGSVWTVSDATIASTTVSRVDPATNRVTKRIRITGAANALIQSNGLPDLRSDGRTLWVVGSFGGVRIDAQSGTIAGRLPWGLGKGAMAAHSALSGEDLWIQAADGRLLLLDARTGARRAQLTGPGGHVSLAALPGGLIVAAEDGTVTRFSVTGRTQWTALPSSAPQGEGGNDRVAIADGVVWVLQQNEQQLNERLFRIDLATGRTLGSTVFKAIGLGELTAAGGELWLVDDLHAIVVSR